MPVRLNSSGGGSVTLDVPSTGSAFNLTLPAANGNLGINLGTAQNSTSGTFIDFPNIPAGVRRVTVMFNGVSTSGSNFLLFQLGTSGGVEATGYTAVGGLIYGTTGSTTSSTAGFPLNSNQATNVNSGAIVFSTLGGNVWTALGGFAGVVNANQALTIAGIKSLSGTLDRIRITTVNGTDTFDAGSINIAWEF